MYSSVNFRGEQKKVIANIDIRVGKSSGKTVEVEEEELEDKRLTYKDEEQLEPTMKEYQEIFAKMKQERAPGRDNICS